MTALLIVSLFPFFQSLSASLCPVEASPALRGQQNQYSNGGQMTPKPGWILLELYQLLPSADSMGSRLSPDDPWLTEQMGCLIYRVEFVF